MNKNKIKIPHFFYGDKSKKIRDILLSVKGLSKVYTDEALFSAVNLTLKPGDRIAIVGPNGTGKSTFLKIIADLEEPDEGIINKNKDLKIGYLPQETLWNSLDKNLLEEAHSANPKTQQINNYRYKGLIECLLENFGFARESWQRKVKSLSGGEKTKLALIKILASCPNVLILDEPTNHLDLETIEWLEQFLLDWKQTIICVSHDRYFLDRICDKTFELTKEGLEKYYCSYSQYLEEREERFKRKEKNYSQQQKYFKEQQKFIDRFRYKATIASRVQSKLKQLNKIERIEAPKKDGREVKINFNIGKKTCTKILEISEAIVGSKELPLFAISDRLTVDWGDKVGIIGGNGAGKSTLLKSIISKHQFIKGKAEINQEARIGYYAQAHEELNPKNDILEEVSSNVSAEEEKIRNVLGGLLFTQDDIFKKIEQLSGGERAKVVLAELILQKANFLLLDEPTNHLDLSSKEVVMDVLREFPGAILLVSHDRYILNKVCNVIWEIKNGELKKYLGNYQDYRYHLGF